MKIMIKVWHHFLPLLTPYRLSFQVLDGFETLYVAVEGDGRVGYGEITPLPGYGSETFEEACQALSQAGDSLAKGKPIKDTCEQLALKYPFTASGITCAFETWREGENEAFMKPFDAGIPVAGLCVGETPAAISAEARRLIENGYTALKLKAGRPPDIEESLVRAVSAELTSGCTIRLDANQAYSPEDALEVCRRLEDLGSIAYLEQPFKKGMWAESANLTKSTTFPVMLDESIWNAEDVTRAVDCGVKGVKFKLAKHLGMAGTHTMVEKAREYGLEIIYGNGVQSGLGNHLEARVHLDTGITTATEGNGFAKVKNHPFHSGLTISKGTLRDKGISPNLESIAKGRLVYETSIQYKI